MAPPKRPFPRPLQPTQDPPPTPAPPLPGLRRVLPVPPVSAVPPVGTTSPGSPEAAAVAKKTAAEYLARRQMAEAEADLEKSVREDDETDERPADARLKSFAAKIKERYDTIKDIFAGTVYDPTKNNDFQKFASDTVAETAMRFLRIGLVHAYDADAVTPDERAKTLRQKGFAIGEANRGAANEKADTAAVEGTDTEKAAEAVSPPPSAGDMAFMASPAVQEALRMGLDLNEDD